MMQIILRYYLGSVLFLMIINSGYSQLSTTAVTTNASCYQSNNASIDLTVTGGVTPYSYIWNNGATTQDISNLVAGSYSVSIYDSNGPLPVPFNWNYAYSYLHHYVIIDTGTIFINGSPISNGDYVGAFYSIPLGGLQCGGYIMYSGVNAIFGIDGDNPITPLKDGFNPYETFNWEVWHHTNGSNGVVVSMTVTYAPLNYPIITGQGNFIADALSIIDNLTGNYSLSSPSSTIDTFAVGQPGIITVTGTINNPTCPAGTNGSVNININGGTSPYSFLWSNGQTMQNATVVAAGLYSLTVTDSHLCLKTANFLVNNPAGMTLSFSETDPTCFGNSDGEIHLNVGGGTSPSQYYWSSGNSTENISQLSSGSYSVSVTDANNCLVTGSTIIAQPDSIAINFNITNVSCSGQADGAINLTVTGGTGNYNYIWSENTGNQTTSSLTSLSVGIFEVSVYDTNDCMQNASYSITQPDDLLFSVSVQNAGCPLCDNGSASLTITGGTTPYSIIWSNGDTTITSADLSPGSYNVTVTDNHNCSVNEVFTVIYSVEIQQITLLAGWSIISTYIIPYNPSFFDVFNPVINDFVIAKNGAGAVFWPVYNLNGIGNFVLGEGYQLKMNTLQYIDVIGLTCVPENSQINIPGGWSIIGYLRQTTGLVVSMLTTISNNIIIVKDGSGNVYWPLYGVNSIVNMQPGKGYQLKVSATCTLTYPAN